MKQKILKNENKMEFCYNAVYYINNNNNNNNNNCGRDSDDDDTLFLILSILLFNITRSAFSYRNTNLFQTVLFSSFA
jgi:hypothetical protein